MTLSQKAVEIALAENGKAEEPKGSNWGTHVQKYLASVGINFPASWCMAFVYWCFEEAARELKVKNPVYKTGGVIVQYNHSKPLYSRNIPQPGDVFIMDHGKGLGHTGIVVEVKNNYIHTIEGNTNDEGSREGYEVCRRKRPISAVKSFLRF